MIIKRGLALFAVALIFVFSGCKGKEANETSLADTGRKTSPRQEDLTKLSLNDLEVLVIDGDKDAAYRLGVIYDYGTEAVEQNFSKAKQWYDRARDLGNKRAALAIGYMYLSGLGVEKNYSEAKTYFEEALEARVADANVGLGRLFMDKDYSGYDPYRAYSCFSSAADNGSLDGKYYLNYVREAGIGTAVDFTNALLGYAEVALDKSDDVEDQFAINSANTRLGLMYVNGKGVEPDYETAMNYFRIASDNGFALAKYYIGVMYESGDNEHEADYDKALRFYEDAAAMEYAPALNQVGYMYCNGLGVDIDYEKALYYQKLSAAQGYPLAMVNLGYLYENGLGTVRSLPTALSYYKLAESEGYDGAYAAVIRVENMIKGSNL